MTTLNPSSLPQGETPTNAVVFYSGEMSWAAGKRAVKKYGVDNTTLLFTDTLSEDEDLYRFLREGAVNIGCELVWLRGNRDIWQVFDDVQTLGSSRKDPCSDRLKRKPAKKWLDQNRDPANTALIFGLDWAEAHRFDGPPNPDRPERGRRGVKNRYARLGWPHVEAPMMEKPYLDRRDIAAWLKLEGIRRANSYVQGFAHDNCGGGCVRAGIGQFVHLYHVRPQVFTRWEAGEIGFNAKRPGKTPQTILRDRTGGVTRPMSLTELRHRIEAGAQFDMFDIGGCGCFVDAA
jgi:hypothetical protein